MTLSASDRKNLAKARLAILGDPVEGESINKTEQRDRYRQMLNEAIAEIAAGASLPYKDNDD